MEYLLKDGPNEVAMMPELVTTLEAEGYIYRCPTICGDHNLTVFHPKHGKANFPQAVQRLKELEGCY